MARPMPPVSPCAPWPCRGTSTPTDLARAATTRLVALRSTTSTALSTIPTGSTTCSSPPPWEVANYKPRNPIESASCSCLLRPKIGCAIGLMHICTRSKNENDLSATEVVLQMVPLGLEHVVVFIFDLPAPPTRLCHRHHVIGCQAM